MRKVVIDTDCGVDDAIAIIMAIKSQVEILGITTVSGNVHVEQVTENVIRLTHFLEADYIPVFKGASRALSEKEVFNTPIHGKNGLGDVELPKSSRKEEKDNAITAIGKFAMENKGFEIVALGPLTNIAIAMNVCPEIKRNISRIFVMGGALERGNVTRFAEFNFRVDPEAADFVLRSGIPITLVPWDPIYENPFTEREIMDIFENKGKLGHFIIEIEQVIFSFAEKYFGVRSVFMADPFAMGVFISNKIANRKISGNLEVELSNNSLRGASILKEGGGIDIVTGLDKLAFSLLLKQTL